MQNSGSLVNALSKSLCHLSDTVRVCSTCQGSDGYGKGVSGEELVSDVMAEMMSD